MKLDKHLKSKIDKRIIDFFENTPSEEPVELVFNDIKLMQKEKKEAPETEEDDSVEIDDLLDHDNDDSEIDKDNN